MEIRLRNGQRQLAGLITVVKDHLQSLSATNSDALFQFVVHCKTGKVIDADNVEFLEKRGLTYKGRGIPSPNTKHIVDAMFDLEMDGDDAVGIVEVDPQG